MNKYFASAIVLAALCGTATANPAANPPGSSHVGSAYGAVKPTSTNKCFSGAQQDVGGALSDADRMEALANCNDALADKQAANDRAATLANRGVLNAAAGNVDAALADYTASLALKPENADVYISRGSALLRAYRPQEARADFDHALSIGTANRTVALFDRGVANEASGDVVAAYHDYKAAAALDPHFRAASVELARFKVSENKVANR